MAYTSVTRAEEDSKEAKCSAAIMKKVVSNIVHLDRSKLVTMLLTFRTTKSQDKLIDNKLLFFIYLFFVSYKIKELKSDL